MGLRLFIIFYKVWQLLEVSIKNKHQMKISYNIEKESTKLRILMQKMIQHQMVPKNEKLTLILPSLKKGNNCSKTINECHCCIELNLQQQ